MPPKAAASEEIAGAMAPHEEAGKVWIENARPTLASAMLVGEDRVVGGVITQ